MTKVGWLGLGAMGLPMARRLHTSGAAAITAFDPAPGVRASAGAEGITVAASPALAAKGADLIMVMVRDTAQAQQALFPEDGTDPVPEPGSTVVLMSTVGPDAVRGLAAALAEREVAVVDAPVSGGVARALTGDLVIMVGAPDDAFDRCRGVLDALGSTVAHVGQGVGDGQSVKLVNQLLCGVHIAAAAEALAYAESLGLDSAAVWQTVRGGAAGSFMLDDRGQRMLGRDYSPVRSSLSLFVKDLGLVVEQAQRGRVPVPLASAAAQMFTMGVGEGLADADDSSLIELFRRWNTNRIEGQTPPPRSTAP
ncbi:NAD(P)-dependent oxidoreductase [Streptomyces sp. NPDC005808]|uniref:NAD(P)-dependent oxidoreductase n=1 Tax=Streptomyces sp. NPDC005808 TaxID=3364734 RepID=UPI0036C56CB6